jgi:predicted acyl esterase
VRFRAAGSQTVLSTGGDPSVAAAFTPVTANDPCKTVAANDAGSGTATYRLPPATGAGYTLLGTPTVIASLTVTGDYPELAERLWDVAPDGTQLLIVRGVLRPRATGKPEPFQLAPAGWHVAAGHVLKLELLGQDSPHFRASNGTFSIQVRDLELRLPVAERPGTVPGVVAPARPVMPAGAVRAADLAPPRRRRRN